MILVPVKNLDNAKQRLAAVLTQEQRTMLARTMIKDIFAALAEVPGRPQVGIVTSDRFAMALARRYAVPFYCMVFALIAAPLGLRHHRTSSAMGLGISLLVIFAFYFTTVYLSTFGESGRMPTTLAAWLPNAIGAIFGIVLIARANR
jgi:lipopolysaccharide export LptBFGC system permease protein LptF